MKRLGLKLFSTNANYVHEAQRLFDKGVYQYIELFSVPGSFPEHHHHWKALKIPFIIHAPHFKYRMDLSSKSREKSNTIMAKESFQFADVLGADQVIFHPGVEGNIQETARQIRNLNDPRILIENKPYKSVDDKYICVGNSPEEIDLVMRETGAAFCLDIGHCICSANSKKIPPLEYIKRFIELKPALYHLTDGDYDSPYDRHDHYGKGSYPIADILKMIPENASITNEAVKDSQENLDDFEKDIEFLRSIH